MLLEEFNPFETEEEKKKKKKGLFLEEFTPTPLLTLEEFDPFKEPNASPTVNLQNLKEPISVGAKAEIPTISNILTNPDLLMKTAADFVNQADTPTKVGADFGVSILNSIVAPTLQLPNTLNQLEVGLEQQIKKKVEKGQEVDFSEVVSLGILKTIPGLNTFTAAANEKMAEIGAAAEDLAKIYQKRRGYEEVDIEKITEVTEKSGYLAGFSEFLFEQDGLINILGTNGASFAAVFLPFLVGPKIAEGTALLTRAMLLTPPAAASMGIDFAISADSNIRESFVKSGGDYDYAFLAGLSKTAADAFAGAATVPLFAGVKFMSKPLYDITAKWIAGGGIESGTYAGVREILGEDVSSGEFIAMAGVSFLLGAPLDVYAAGLFNEVGKAVNIKPVSPDLFAPKTREEYVVLKKFLLDAQKKFAESEQALGDLTTNKDMNPALSSKLLQAITFDETPPFTPIMTAAKTAAANELNNLPNLPGGMPPDKLTQVGRAPNAWNVFETAVNNLQNAGITYNSAGRKSSGPVIFANQKPGTVVGILENPIPTTPGGLSTLKSAMDAAANALKQAMANANVTDPMHSSVKAERNAYQQAATAYKYADIKNTYAEQIFKYIHNIVSKWVKAVAPDEAFILTDMARSLNIKLGAFIAAGKGPAGQIYRLLVYNPDIFLKFDYSKAPDANGNYPVTLDGANLIGALFHELFHGFWIKAVSKFPQKIKEALVTSYSNYLTSINNNPNMPMAELLEKTTPVPERLMSVMYGSEQTVKEAFGRQWYVFTLPEYVANLFAREFLYGDKIMQEFAPEVRAALAKQKVFFDDFVKKAASVLGSPDYLGAQDILRYLARDKILQKETDLFNKAEAFIKSGGKGKKPERVVMKQHPITTSDLWVDAFDSSDIITRTPKELLDLVNDTKYSRAERQAMQDTIRDMNLDRTPDAPISSVELAARYDQRLQFEKAIDANYAALNPIVKAIRNAFGLTPKFKKIEGDIAETGRISAIFKTVYQIAWDNPDNRYLKKHTEILKKMVKERNTDFTKLQPLMQKLKGIAFEDKNIIGEYMFHKHAGTVKARIEELATIYENTRGLDKATALREAANYVVKQEFKMTPERLAISKEIFAYLKDTLNNLEQAEISSVLTTAARLGRENEVSTLNKIAGIKRKYSAMRRKGDYFPAMRFGDNALKIIAKYDTTFEGKEYKAGETVYFELFESEKERSIVWDEMRKNLNSDFAITGYKVSDNLRNLKAISLDFIYESRDAIQEVLQARGLKPEEIKATMREVDDIARAYLSDNSFAKRMMRRKNVLGSSTDLERVLAAYTEAYSNQRTRLLLRPEFDQNMSAYREYINKSFEDIDDRSALKHRGRHDVIYKYMQDHASYLFYPGWEGEGLKTLGFLWHLALNVKAAIVNFSSLPIYTYSHLARYFGDEAAGRAIAESMRDITAHGVNGKIDYTPVTEEVMKRLRNTGMLSQTLSRDMASVALGGTLERIFGRKYGRWGKNAALDLLHYSAYLFQYTELFAREAAALATIRLAEKAGLNNVDQITQLAQDTIDRSLFEYGRHNRPKIFRGAISPLFLFQQFVVNSLYFATRKNASAMRFALLTFAASGAMGLPGAEDIVDLIDAAGTLYSKYVGNGKPIDVRKFIREIFDNTYINSDFVLHGFGRNGLGLQHVLSAVTGVETEFDLSSSLSMGRVVPFGLAQYLRNVAYGKDAELQDQIDEIAGPAYAPFFGILAALSSPYPDDWKNAELAMPTAMRNASKAVRWMVRGEEIDRTGAPILKFDMENPEHLVDAALMALSITPTRVSQEMELNRMRRDHDIYWESQKAAIMEEFRNWFTQSRKNGVLNQDELRGLKEEIIRFNKLAPPGYRIEVRGLEQSITQKLRRDILKEQGYISGSVRDVGKDFSELFPDRKNRNKERDEPKITPYP